jgi:capsular exopolysaccharide synthesis family protein
MDMSKFLNILRRYSWLLVLTTLIASLTTFIVVKQQPAAFEARARLLVGPSMDSPSPDLNSLKIGGQLIMTYAELVHSRPFLESINSKLAQNTNVEALGKMIDVRQNSDTRILTIIVTHQDAKQAVAIANAAAELLIEMSPSKDNTASMLRIQMSAQSRQVEQIITSAETSIQNLEDELMVLGNKEPSGPEAAQAILDQQNLVTKQLSEERARLSDALRTLATIYQVLLDTNANQLEIFEPADAIIVVNQNAPLKSAASGGAGLIFAVVIIFALEYFDDTLRNPGDFTKVAGVQLLSMIGRKNHLTGSGLARIIAYAQPRSVAANDYRTAAAKLNFSIGELLPYTLMVSSVGSKSGDDAADVAANLAVVFAQAGNRVILVDAQLNNPVLTELFNAYNNPGLVDVLADNQSKLQLTQVKDVPGLRLLPAGLSSKINSDIVLNSAKIAKQIEELKRDADIVLVASSPISWFAEGLTLASLVNGIILVARQGDAHGKTVNDVVKNLRGMNTQLVGVIFDQNSLPLNSKQNLKNISEDVGVPLENGMSKKS